MVLPGPSWIVKLARVWEIFIYFKGAEKDFTISSFLKKMLEEWEARDYKQKEPPDLVKLRETFMVTSVTDQRVYP